MQLNLNNKVALVTGSNRGTGEVIARVMASEGAQVLLHGPDQASAESVAATFNAIPVWGDISSTEGVECLHQCIKEKADHVDILINNFGTASGGKWESFDNDAWIDIYQKNVLSAANITARLLPQMKTLGWGRIIQISTIGSLNPNARMPHYYASKGALSNMTVSLCKELSGTGITVNTVSPGLIKTDELEAGYRMKAAKKGWGDNWDDIEAHIVRSDFPNPSGRIARKEEIADLVAFLSSEKANFINGQNIRVDGGAIGLSI